MAYLYTVTLACPDDAEGINQVFYQTWLATYPNSELGITKELIDMRVREWILPDRIEKRRYLIVSPPTGETMLVAKQQRKIVGVCAVVRHSTKNRLQAIYVLPEFQGKGIGRSLWEEALRYLDGAHETLLSVVTYNKKTIRFYESLGFRDTGARFSDPKFELQNGIHLPEMEMMRPKVPAP